MLAIKEKSNFRLIFFDAFRENDHESVCYLGYLSSVKGA